MNIKRKLSLSLRAKSFFINFLIHIMISVYVKLKIILHNIENLKAITSLVEIVGLEEEKVLKPYYVCVTMDRFAFHIHYS